jgi:hypothetical protein
VPKPAADSNVPLWHRPVSSGKESLSNALGIALFANILALMIYDRWLFLNWWGSTIGTTVAFF